MEHLSEILMHLGEDREQYFHAVAPPVIQSSNFAFPDLPTFRKSFADDLNHHVYTRGNNPTVEILRKKLAALEGTDDALVFSSGTAAISAAVIGNVKTGDHIICQHAPYSWTYNLLTKFLVRFGVEHTFVNAGNLAEIEQAIRPNTTVLYLESPNSMTYDCQDLEACSALAKKHGIVTMIDNSYATPIYQNPAAFGIDIVIHSGTKYLNGHSDVVMGAVCASNEIIERLFHSELMTLGSILSPHDAALVIRGLRTLPIRLERSDKSAQWIIEQLEKHPKTERVWYPFHHSFPQRELAQKQMKGCGGLFSVQFKTDSQEKMEAFVHRLRRFAMAVSWGGHESLMLPTIAFYHVEGRPAPPVHWTFCRFYIGLEDPEWLWEDIQQAMEVL